MKESLKQPTVILFVIVGCGILCFSQFAAHSIGSPLDEAMPINIDILGADLASGNLKSSRIAQSHIWNAAPAALTLAADDENDDEDGAEDGKDKDEGFDRLWDSPMLG